MKLLAIDTATEQCSVALAVDGALFTRVVSTARNHADMILPLVNEVLSEAGLALKDLDGLAFGRGPGSFTGVRIAVGVAQGLALASGLPVVGISNLAAVAQLAATTYSLPTGAHVLVCMDARMQEVYWAVYRVSDRVELVSIESVSAPSAVMIDGIDITFGAGTGWQAYPVLRERYPGLKVDDGLLPRATEIAMLGQAALQAGLGVRADQAQPVYLRDDVARPSVA
jgi:tRNA threonylcarbamoyladenosine biosynthesis protein TsaB